MESGANEPDPGPHLRSGLSRAVHAVTHRLLAQTEETDLIAHGQSQELLEESGRKLTDLPNREAALLGYIKSRES
ncbi:MAG: hypothetical protein QOE09_1864 [Ilumatobacteraceae bacterium]|jgi:hypothetical protein